MAQATDRDALIVAHGSPSSPAVQEAALAALAVRVAGHFPGWRLRGATLARLGAVEAAMADLDQPLVYPLFIAPGWFVDTQLPARLGPRTGRCLAPLGTDFALPDLVADVARRTLDAHGLALRDTAILFAAHGSPKRPESRRAVARFAAALDRLLAPRALYQGFIDEPPYLHDAARGVGQALCVPFFVANAGHVDQDLPAALCAAGFTGPVLPPLIRYPGLDQLIAGALAHVGHARVAA